jgi:magnesium transporter
MINGYRVDRDRLLPVNLADGEPHSAMWLDLVEPTPEEEALVEKVTGIEVPTRDEMAEIEISSRLYEYNGAIYLTALVLSNTESEAFVLAPVTFILGLNRLITVRYHAPKSFAQFEARAQKEGAGCATAAKTLVTLLETIVDRLADTLERTARDIDLVSARIFGLRGAAKAKGRGYEGVLVELGRHGDLSSGIRDSLVTLDRMTGFLILSLPAQEKDKVLRERLKTLARDIHSLADHTAFLSQKVTFLLDATLGLINIEQNNIIKIFSIAAVVFLPPTLVASIYGMNFHHMPELDWWWGYPLALAVMVISALLPVLYFKHRNWL